MNQINIYSHVSDVNMAEMKKLDLNIEILKDYFSAIK